MKIKEKCNGTINPKSKRKYSVPFKKRMVEYYLSGYYDEDTILQKFQINRTLLKKWHTWYYQHFQSKDYTKANYGSGKQPCNTDSRVKKAIEAVRGSLTQRTVKDCWSRETYGINIQSNESEKKNWTVAVLELRKDFPQSSMEELCAVFGKSR